MLADRKPAREAFSSYWLRCAPLRGTHVWVALVFFPEHGRWSSLDQGRATSPWLCIVEISHGFEMERRPRRSFGQPIFLLLLDRNPRDLISKRGVDGQEGPTVGVRQAKLRRQPGFGFIHSGHQIMESPQDDRSWRHLRVPVASDLCRSGCFLPYKNMARLGNGTSVQRQDSHRCSSLLHHTTSDSRVRSIASALRSSSLLHCVQSLTSTTLFLFSYESHM
jgi:hypothetical protein